MENPMNSSSKENAAIKTRLGSVYRLLQAAIDARVFPGCAFGVLAISSDGSERQFYDALGRFTFDTDSPAVTPATLYDIASLTKVVATTSTAMLLHQRGQLVLDQPLGDLLPGFIIGRTPGEKARYVQLRHLLAHNCGLPAYVEFFRTCQTPEDLFRACLTLPLEADPGARAAYSDPGFILLGKALRVALREPIPLWLSRNIFQPLQMDSTLFNPPPALRPLIPPTEIDTIFRQRPIQGEVQDENAFLLGGIAGHAGLFSNVPDLLCFSRSLLASSQDGLFTPQTIDYFSKRQSPEGSSRALGWDTPSAESSSTGSHFSPRSIGHLGFSGCSLWIDLDARIAITLLTNRTWPDRKNKAIRKLRPAFHDALRQAL
jgi:CubicO group peptidase (beta-lactamase class C family)